MSAEAGLAVIRRTALARTPSAARQRAALHEPGHWYQRA
jgi:hypothetical protein